MRKQHYLVVWGRVRPESIRAGTGVNEREAMKMAWGLVSPNMTAIPITLYELRTWKWRRLKMIELLQKHKERYLKGYIKSIFSPQLDEEERNEAVESIDKYVGEILERR